MDFNYNSYNIIASKDLEDLCDRSSHNIFDALEKISLISTLYLECRIKVLPPFAANFRDALFHYKKLYESDTIEEAIAQSEAINEHLSRAIKDSLMQLSQTLLCAILALYESNDITDDTKSVLQHAMHLLKQAILKLRINSMDIVRVSQDDFGAMDEISSCITTCANNNIKDLLIEKCSQYIKETKVFLKETDQPKN